MQPAVAIAAAPGAAQPAAATTSHTGWSLQSQFGDRSATTATAVALPVAPVPPAKFEYQEPPAVVPVAPAPSRVPAIPQNVAFSDLERCVDTPG